MDEVLSTYNHEVLENTLGLVGISLTAYSQPRRGINNFHREQTTVQMRHIVIEESREFIRVFRSPFIRSRRA
jgi:hypothetical protein